MCRPRELPGRWAPWEAAPCSVLDSGSAGRAAPSRTFVSLCLPPAVAQCAQVTRPAHGSVDCSRGPAAFPWNTTCAFRCEDGFALVGAPRLRCTAAGHWDHEEPTCSGSAAPPVGIHCSELPPSPPALVRPPALLTAGPCVTAVTCGALDPPPHGSVSCSLSPAGELALGSSCSFACEEGFLLRGPARVECTARGQWAQPAPLCEGEPGPPQPVGGRGGRGVGGLGMRQEVRLGGSRLSAPGDTRGRTRRSRKALDSESGRLPAVPPTEPRPWVWERQSLPLRFAI